GGAANGKPAINPRSIAIKIAENANVKIIMSERHAVCLGQNAAMQNGVAMTTRAYIASASTAAIFAAEPSRKPDAQRAANPTEITEFDRIGRLTAKAPTMPIGAPF
ncbi:MAG: hypothetical protein KJN99_08300, partial [Marinicaulis sp.]|nr:hypothetical protein [Marinicaulis sp.]